MRYGKDHKEKTRQRLIATAAASIRRDGVAGCGVIGLAAELGLTQGALYRHFPSKDQLVEAAACEAMRQMLAKLETVVATARSAEAVPIEAIIDWYLDVSHWEAWENGCLMAALGGELARQSNGVRQAAMTLMENAIGMIAAQIPDGTIERATALYGLLTGTLQLSRIALTDEKRDMILAGGREAARALVRG